MPQPIKKQTFKLISLCCFVLLATCFLGFYNIPAAAAEKKPAPGLKNISSWNNSTPLDLGSLKGKVVLLEFWSTRCPNCMQSISHTIAWNNKYSKQGLVVIGVHVPLKKNTVDDVKQVITDKGINYPVAMDDNRVSAKLYDVHQLPTYFLIDKEGLIQYKKIGIGNYQSFEKYIKKLTN